MKKYGFTVGGVDITEAMANFSLVEQLNEMSTGVLKLKPSTLLSLPALNYAVEVCVTRLQGSEPKVIFRGNIVSVTPKPQEIEVKLAAGIELFQETMIRAMAVADIGHLELLWTIVRGAGLDDDHINIEGFQKGPIEPFEVIVPIEGIELSQDLSFPGFELTTDPKIIETAKSTGTDKHEELLSDFSQSNIWLRLIVRAKMLHDAEDEALNKIDVFIARLTSRLQASGSRLDDYHGAWDRNQLFSLPVRGDAIFVRGLTTGRRWLRRPFESNTPVVDIAKIEDINFPPLAHNLPQYLVEALMAWHRSIRANHTLAAITATWDAIEFYSSQIKVDKGFTPSELKQICNDAVNSLAADDKRRERIANLLGNLNDASLILKFNRAMEEDSVTLAQEELDILIKLRNTRNDFTHGKKVTMPSNADMLLARTVVNRVITARIYRLTQKAKNPNPTRTPSSSTI